MLRRASRTIRLRRARSLLPRLWDRPELSQQTQFVPLLPVLRDLPVGRQPVDADATDQDPQALPEELARREALKAKLDAACARLEAEARAEAEAADAEYEAKKAAYDAKTGRRGRPPKPPEETPPPERQSNLTDPDSALMRRSDAHEYRQAYNAQAIVCAEGSQLILATNLVATTANAPSFAATVLGMKQTVGLPKTVLH